MIVGRDFEGAGLGEFYKGSGESRMFLEKSSQEYGELVGNNRNY